MHIVFDPAKVPETLIVAKVQKAGFGCKTQTDTDSSGSAFDAGKFSGGKAYTGTGLGHGKNAAQKTQAHTLASAWFFALLLMYVSMGYMIGLPLPPLFAPERFPSNFALLNLLCTVPILFIGRAFYFRGFKSAFHLNPNMDTLVALGSTSAFIYNLVLTFLIPLKPQLVHDLYYEAAAFVLVFVMSGKYLEARGKEKTKRAIEALMTLQSDTAFYVDNFGTASETVRETALAQVKPGDIVLVKGDLRDAAKAVKLSRMTIRNIKQNLFWAFFYNSIGLPLAAGLLYRAYGVLLSPMIASFAMSLSSVFVVTNALRLRGKKL